MSTQRDAHTEMSIQIDVIQRDVYTERCLHIKMSAHKDVYIHREILHKDLFTKTDVHCPHTDMLTQPNAFADGRI